jgi:hypothetical protein
MLSVLALVGVLGGPAAADPLPTWDTVINGAPRFRLLVGFNNQAVLDRETGIVWERSPETTLYTWVVAHRVCVDKGVGNRNRKGWRLPTVQELLTLLEPTRDAAPFLPLGHPFLNVQSDFYWSANTFGENSGQAWGAGFENNLTEPGARFTSKTSTGYVWCVRTGHGGPDTQ